MLRPSGRGGQAPPPPRDPPPPPVAQGRIAEADDGLGLEPVINVSDITRPFGYIFAYFSNSQILCTSLELHVCEFIDQKHN